MQKYRYSHLNQLTINLLNQMKIHIHSQATIAEIQRQFSAMFPYLKLEFFSKLHRTGEATHSKFMMPHNRRLDDIRKTQREGELDI